jgi:protein TonB
MKLLPWVVSVLVHGLILLEGNVSVQSTVAEVTPGRASMEVQLVDALDKPHPSPSTVPSPSISATTDSKLSHVPKQPADAPPKALFSVRKRSSPKDPSTRKNGNSRAHASKDAARDFVLPASGAIVEREPDYLSNPPPTYPVAAQRERQQGLVILDVIVSADGRSEDVRILSGSGYYLLDEAARKAVRHYRFRPTTLNGVKVRSHVRVPIRFRLDE